VSEVRVASIIARMMEAARISETSLDNYFTRQYIPEDNLNFRVIFLVFLNRFQDRVQFCHHCEAGFGDILTIVKYLFKFVNIIIDSP
jgi:hypothetical protein